MSQVAGRFTQSSLLENITGLRHGFSNLSVPKDEIDAIDNRTATAKQIHKADLIWATSLEKRARDADAIATFLPNMPVGVYSADCTPILLAALDDATNKVYAIMAAHAGWRSTALGIAHKGFREFHQTALKHHGRPSHFLGSIGPCISKESFEVGPDVVEAFPGSEARGIAQFLRMENGIKKYLFDLPGENLRQLKEAGQATGAKLKVDMVGLCTFKLTGKFPSYRRDKAKDGRILSFLEFTG